MRGQATVEEICSTAGISIDQHRPWDLRVHNADFYDRVLADGSLGLGEAYMLGWWDADDLFGFFERLLSAGRTSDRKNIGWRTTFAFLKARLVNVQTKSQARTLADAHYNLSNELFERMLGPSMAYSCGYWTGASDLDDAQFAKYDMICRKLQLEPGERLLDIGCGWGGFARYAARNYDVEVIGLTISSEQAAYARALCAGLPIEINCCDYREFDQRYHDGSIDKVASIGMIEHVGYRNYRKMFEVVCGALRPRGLFLLHNIGSAVSTEVGDPWLNTYIFPGGVLPSMKQLSEAAERLFILQDVQNIGVHYTPTLRAWHENFEAYWSSDDRTEDRPQVWGSCEVFYRMWRYYLLCCAAEFRTGGSQVWQSVYAKGHLDDGYLRAH
ncbi:MAG: cyclopropane fatty acyl phospholipid synthase [Pseudomonadota bacterium]